MDSYRSFFIIGLAYFVVVFGLRTRSNYAWIITLMLCSIVIIVGTGSLVVGRVGAGPYF